VVVQVVGHLQNVRRVSISPKVKINTYTIPVKYGVEPTTFHPITQLPSKLIKMKLSNLLIFVLLSLLCSCNGCGNDSSPPATGNPDIIRINNTQSGEEIGVLIDGNIASVAINDSAFVSIDSDVELSEISGSGEAIIFNNRRPPTLRQNISWTTDKDILSATMPDETLIPVTVWILHAPFTTNRANAIDWSLTTSMIWENERMGVGFEDYEIIDATNDPNAANYLTFTCSIRTNMMNDIGSKPGRINIYIVETVDGGTSRGQACSIGSDFVAMASGAGTELLSHEIGHNFGLLHIDSRSDFNRTNVMHSASNTRQYFSEGQLFRAHFNPNSALNDTYNVRPGLPTRNCGHLQTSNQCPDIGKRIWDDGTFRPN